MSEITGSVVAHEAYAFACMRCGHGWESAYDIEHHVDGDGHNFVVYKCEGLRVPSPLSSPTCGNCGGHVVRIMRSGQVSSVRALAGQFHTAETPAAAAAIPGTASGAASGTTGVTSGSPADAAIPGDGGAAVKKSGQHHHWHLSDLLHPFHHQHHDESRDQG
ncbi:hypothetical protein HY68_14515 [Streptomyces sp. AcH 505]|uniref:hypothetical protein n=1 Tax=Streptomyces sp. AcH 505 TaxID=352211 RepID=UPI0005923EC7|nr:hypothetical protein HY68_14515 [Streptomyces sp. AcH 505]